MLGEFFEDLRDMGNCGYSGHGHQRGRWGFEGFMGDFWGARGPRGRGWKSRAGRVFQARGQLALRTEFPLTKRTASNRCSRLVSPLFFRCFRPFWG